MKPPRTTNPRIYLDANVIIDAFENLDQSTSLGRSVLDLIRKGFATGVISELIIAELLVKPLELDDDEMCAAYEGLFDASSIFETRRIDRDILIQAAKERAKRKTLKMPDAIHIATARLAGCVAFVTADKRLSLPQDLIVIPLDVSAADRIRALA
jgi:predicted nucleic acid-binding protein